MRGEFLEFPMRAAMHWKGSCVPSVIDHLFAILNKISGCFLNCCGSSNDRVVQAEGSSPLGDDYQLFSAMSFISVLC